MQREHVQIAIVIGIGEDYWIAAWHFLEQFPRAVNFLSVRSGGGAGKYHIPSRIVVEVADDGVDISVLCGNDCTCKKDAAAE